MPRGKGIDKEKVYKLIKAGKNAVEIMNQLKISNKSTFKSALAEIMIDKGEVLKVPGLRGRTTGNRKINKMGLQIPMSLLEHQFKAGDEFSIEIGTERIVLKKV